MCLHHALPAWFRQARVRRNHKHSNRANNFVSTDKVAAGSAAGSGPSGRVAVGDATLRTGATWLLVAPISCPRSLIFVRFGLYLRGARAARPFVGSPDHRRSPHTVTLTFTVVPDARRSPSAGALPPECTYGIGRLAHAALSLWVVSPLSPPACVSFCWSVQFLVGPVNGSSHKSSEKQIFE